jgi:transposase
MYRGEKLGTMDIQAMLRAVRAGKSNRYIADNLGVDRRTVSKYRQVFEERDLLSGELPELEQLNRLLEEQQPSKEKGRPSSIETWAQPIQHYVDKGLRPRLIYQKLSEDPRFGASESAVYRYVRKLRPPAVQATIRVETAPGQEGQVDFGKVGKLWDAGTQTMRAAWIFTLILSWSRHMYVEFVFDQKVETWLACHCHAFEYLGGIPARLKIDNLKAGITQACFDDPQVQRAYAECAEHYGFRIDPCRPYKPQHKGKVERGAVGYVKSSFVPLLPEMCMRSQANAQVREWLLETAGQREHGTTRVAPLVRFAEEKGYLQPLPPSPFEPSVWKKVKLYNDCHVVFGKSYYSAPFRLLGQSLHLRATLGQVEVYDGDFRLVATHSRATTAGERHTLIDHLPPEKVAGLVSSREALLQAAQSVGPYTAQAAQHLLDERPLERSQMVQRILGLADRYDAARLEAACERGLYFDDVRYRTLKRILEQGLEQGDVPQFPTADGGTLVYARTQEEFATAFMTLARGGAA